MDENIKQKDFSNSPLGVRGKLFLIGMMGSGKSYWAQKIAAATNYNWMDLDVEIEKENGTSIKEIFETEGENTFRLMEQKALYQLAKHSNIIIATGGGAPCFFDNIDWMNAHGITVFIDEPIEVLVTRLQKEKAHRPLVSNTSDNELYVSLTERLASRIDFYKKAQHTIIGSQATVEDFIKLINH